MNLRRLPWRGVAATAVASVLLTACPPQDGGGGTIPELPDRTVADWSAVKVEDGTRPTLYVSWWPGSMGTYAGGWASVTGSRWERISYVGPSGSTTTVPRRILGDCTGGGISGPLYCSIAQGPNASIAVDQLGGEVRFHYESMTVSADGRYLFGLTQTSGFVRWDMDDNQFMSLGDGGCSALGFACDIPTAISSSGRYVAIGRLQWGSAPGIVDFGACTPKAGDRLPTFTCESHPFDELLGVPVDRVFKLLFVGDDSLLMGTNTALPGGGDGSYRLVSRTGPQPRGVVALGDSFSSGEGAADATYPYVPGSDDDPENLCHQSPRAWPTQVATVVAGRWPKASFACSGAVAADLTSAQYPDSAIALARSGQIQQLEEWAALNGDPAAITLTLGGNDAGFAGFLMSCVTSLTTCADPPQVEQTESDLLSAANLVYASLVNLRRSYPYSEIYLSSYPRILDGSSLSCGANVGAPSFDPNERHLAERAGEALTALLRDASAKAGVRFVDVSDILGEHVLCGGADPSWVNGVTLGNDVFIVGKESFHPNGLAHDAWASAFRSRGGPIGRQPAGSCPGQPSSPNPCADSSVSLIQPELSNP